MSKKKDLPDTLCPQPFLYVYPNHFGSWKPCCKTYSWPRKIMDFEEYWYEDQDLHDLRKSLITGEHSDIWERTCKECIESEKQNAESYRTHALNKIKRSDELTEGLSKIIDSFMLTGEVFADRRMYNIKVRGFGNECNLTCYMCAPHFSSRRTTEVSKMSDQSIDSVFPDITVDQAKELLVFSKTIPKQKDETKDQLLKVIETLKPQIRQISLGGGEPVMIKEYYELLDSLIETGDSREIIMSMNTNCTRTGIHGRDILDYVDAFKEFTVLVSIDDLYERDEFIRYPSKFNTVLDNLNKYVNETRCDVRINITWSLLNISNAPAIIDFFRQRGLQFSKSVNVVTKPEILNPSNHPNRDELIEEYVNSGDVFLVDLARTMMASPFKQEELDKAIDYIKELDKIRETKSYNVFHELKDYLL